MGLRLKGIADRSMGETRVEAGTQEKRRQCLAHLIAITLFNINIK